MKKSEIKNIIKEVLKEEVGYSRYAPGGKTNGLTKDTLDKILLRIANGDAEVTEDEDDQVARGNKILDKADPENVTRILRGEEPIYEVERMQELAGIQSEIRVNNPNPLKIDDLEPLEIYNFTYKLDYLDNGKEQNDNLKFFLKDDAGEGDFIIVNHVGGDDEDSFELYPEDIISIRRI